MANVKFEGHDFELKTGPLNELVMTEFSAATAGLDPDTSIPPDVMLALLHESVAEKDINRFLKLGRKTDQFWEKAIEVFKARVDVSAEVTGDFPTVQSSDSTAGPQNTEPSSDPNSDDKILELVGGRVDKLKMIKDAQRAKRAS